MSSIGAGPRLWPLASNCAGKTLGVATQRAQGGGLQSSVLLNLKPRNIFQGGHSTVHIHQVSVTNEKKRGQFLVMLLIIEFCSVLRENPQAISLKVGPARACARTHTHTHTRERESERKLLQKTSYVFFTAQMKIKFKKLQLAVKEGNNGTHLFLSVKTI